MRSLVNNTMGSLVEQNTWASGGFNCNIRKEFPVCTYNTFFFYNQKAYLQMKLTYSTHKYLYFKLVPIPITMVVYVRAYTLTECYCFIH